jgi:hypothetical protein
MKLPDPGPVRDFLFLFFSFPGSVHPELTVSIVPIVRLTTRGIQGFDPLGELSAFLHFNG